MRSKPDDLVRGATISVVVPVFNTRPYLEEAVRSIRAQNLPNLEVIAVDDGSTDGSAEEWERIAPEFKLIRSPNQGPSKARNLGLEHTSGEFVTFLDSDDIWPIGKLAAQLEALQAEPGLSAALGEVEAFADLPDHAGVEVRKFARPMFIFLLGGMLCRRESFDGVGPFNADKFPFNGEDTDWFYRAWEQGLRMRVLERTTLYYRRRPGSLTADIELARKGLSGILKASLDRRRTMGIQHKPLPDTLLFPESYKLRRRPGL